MQAHGRKRKLPCAFFVQKMKENTKKVLLKKACLMKYNGVRKKCDCRRKAKVKENANFKEIVKKEENNE